ncbi:MAG TPA: EAL domain-containing protein [Pyrinomonadaceae bacterium]|nr:EAL domain-containing protein [Pyrinomonadaceae bacterium]
MERKEKRTNLYLAILAPCGLAAILWALVRFPYGNITVGMVALSIVTIFLSSNLRFQLPRVKIHITISDALVFLSMIMYGGPAAILITVLETAFASWNFRRQGVTMKRKTIAINLLISALTVFVTAMAARSIFGPAPDVIKLASGTFVSMLAIITLTQFLVNSFCVSAFISIKSGTAFWKVWHEYCLNALVMYISGGVMAGFGAKALEQIDGVLFVAVIGFFGLVYFTYRRYVDDIKATAAKAEEAERQRAEQAESHVKELEHYVVQLEKSGQALKKSHERFRHAAFHDALTGLPNRNYFIDAIKQLLKTCSSDADHKFAVLFLDLNRFKTINDSLGHMMGDRLIKNVAKRLSNIAGENIVGRFSGDEFALILPEIDNTADVAGFADRIAARLAEPYSLIGRKVFTSACIGIAFGNGGYRRAEDLLRDADIAMYYAKDSKQNFVVFDKQMHTKAVSQLQLETDLRHAIERKEFEIYYQPIVNLDDGAVSGFEALVRWNHPKHGLISPSDFIPVSESTDLIVPLTLMILQESCRQVGEWSKDAQNRSLFVSVNLSGKHFDHPDLVEQIKDVLDETRFDPTCLKLEITETAVMENAETAISMLKSIKELGVKISIDDFGTGYSSLSYLHKFPIDTLKIDRSFVNSIDDGSENEEIVRTIVALAKALNLTVVAEGIENVNQFQYLSMLGCESGQGYLFSRPLPATEIVKLLNDEAPWDYVLPIQHQNVVSVHPYFS